MLKVILTVFLLIYVATLVVVVFRRNRPRWSRTALPTAALAATVACGGLFLFAETGLYEHLQSGVLAWLWVEVMSIALQVMLLELLPQEENYIFHCEGWTLGWKVGFLAFVVVL